MTDQRTLITVGGKPALRFERTYRAVGADLTFVDDAQHAAARAVGAGARAGNPVSWKVEATAQGSLYVLKHDSIGDDAELAAAWHALLVQLDMYLAAGPLVPVDGTRWIAAYEAVLRA